MAIFLALSHLANSQAFSANASCLSHRFTRHNIHDKENMLLLISAFQYCRNFTLVKKIGYVQLLLKFFCTLPSIMKYFHKCVFKFMGNCRTNACRSLASGFAFLLLLVELTTESTLVSYITCISSRMTDSGLVRTFDFFGFD